MQTLLWRMSTAETSQLGRLTVAVAIVLNMVRIGIWERIDEELLVKVVTGTAAACRLDEAGDERHQGESEPTPSVGVGGKVVEAGALHPSAAREAPSNRQSTRIEYSRGDPPLLSLERPTFTTSRIATIVFFSR